MLEDTPPVPVPHKEAPGDLDGRQEAHEEGGSASLEEQERADFLQGVSPEMQKALQDEAHKEALAEFKQQRC